jgi:sodium/potassium-transporting ATPase subunit alpha
LIPAVQLVTGDLILLEEGDRVPADARLFEVAGLKVNNASLIGESEPQLRSIEPTDERLLESRNVVFSGTMVQAGSGKAIVFATGMSTQIGRTADLTQAVGVREIPIRREIDHFTRIISMIAIVMGAVVFLISSFFLDNPFWSRLIFAIGIIVANVPEGLLPTVTLCLSIAARRMASKNALIRNLESVETLGCTTVIIGTPHKKTRRLTQSGRKRALSGWKLSETCSKSEQAGVIALLSRGIYCGKCSDYR